MGWSYGFIIRDNVRITLYAHQNIIEGVNWGWQVYWEVTRYDANTGDTTLIARKSIYSHQVKQGVGERNELYVIAKGRFASIGVNDVWVADDLDLGGAEAGRFGIETGVFADSEVEGATTWYSAYYAWVPECEGIPALPSNCK